MNCNSKKLQTLIKPITMKNKIIINMKLLIIIIFQCGINMTLIFSQTKPISKNQLKDPIFQPNDKVFVQTDRNIYRAGDTIYFQAYIKDNFTGNFKSNSKALYALLFNEQKQIVDSSRFWIDGFGSPGWMTIPPEAKPGKYRFIAFTSIMQNYDPKNAFMIDLKVEQQNGIPLKSEVAFDKKTYLPGDTVRTTIKITNLKKHLIKNQKFICNFQYAENLIVSEKSRTNGDGISQLEFLIPDTLTNSPKLQVTIGAGGDQVVNSFNVPYKNQHVNLSFLPEGGTLIEGLNQRIGFNATNIKGEPIIIEGLLKDANNKIIDSIKSGKFGPGSFTCKPQNGMFVELINAEFDNKIWPITNIEKNGFSLSVIPKDKESFTIQVQSDKYTGEQVFVKGIMGQEQIFLQELKLDKIKTFIFKTDSLLPGLVQICLCNKDMQPIAERLIYISASTKLEFNIATDSISYNPGKETELVITATEDGGLPAIGVFSISVVDAATGIAPELFMPGIEYSLNFHPYFMKNLQAKALYDGFENLTDEQLDILLMVFGWSKIHHTFSTNDSIDRISANYDLLKMKLLYTVKWRKADRRLDVLSLEDASIKHLLTDKRGEIVFPLDSLNDKTRTIILMPDTKNKKQIFGVTLDIPSNKQYFKNDKLFAYLPLMEGEIINISPPTLGFLKTDSVYKISEVVITKNIIKEFNDEYEEIYQCGSVRTIGYERLWGYTDIGQVIRGLTMAYILRDISGEESVYLGGGIKALFVIDGNPIYGSGWWMVRSMSPVELKSITILKSAEANAVYGSEADGGVIFINTMSHDFDPKLQERYNKWLSRYEKSKLYIPMHIYRSYREFYNPSKSELSMNPFLQERPTIYWNPLVYFDKEPVKIKFPNLKRQGKVIVTINGVSTNNLSGTGKISYQVQ
jgi:hypothetical protein